MLIDKRGETVVSSIGWVDRGSVAVRDFATSETRTVNVASADYLRLFDIDGVRFMVAAHAPADGRLVFSVRSFRNPEIADWSMVVRPRGFEIEGNPAMANGARRFHVASFKEADQWLCGLVVVSPSMQSASFSTLPWFEDGPYDLGYQGLTDAIPDPSSECALISVQRSSTVIVHDLVQNAAVDRFDLAGRLGNPVLQVIGDEIWTIDYDTFVRVNTKSRRVVQRTLIQSGDAGTRQFAGDLFAWKSRNLAIVPRPFSEDVVIVNPITGKIESTVVLGRQPILCVANEEGKLLGRDWKTGDWLSGTAPASRRRRKLW